MRITFLSPRLPPAVCGLADHTRFLAEAIKGQGAEVGFIYCKAQQDVDSRLPGPAAYWNGNPSGLETNVSKQCADWLWVQLSSYGFSRWGAPYRLGIALRRLRTRMPQVRLAICLHELHCKPSQLGLKGPILSPWQKYTVGKIAQLGDIVFATNEVWKQLAIEEYGLPPAKVHRLPIGSNIPEISLSPGQRAQVRCSYGWHDKELIAVAFGSFGSQMQALRLFERKLIEGFEEGILGRLVCMGGESPAIPMELRQLASAIAQRGAFQILGTLPALEVARILACCDFGLCITPPAILEKSGAFMACAAAGLAVISSRAFANGYPASANLPVLYTETFDWRQGRSAAVQQIKHDLHQRAQNEYRWSSIAERALACLKL